MFGRLFRKFVNPTPISATQDAPIPPSRPKSHPWTPVPVSQYKITKREMLRNFDQLYSSEYTKEVSGNLDRVLEKINIVRKNYGEPMVVNSGWRPLEYNRKVPGAALKSKHIKGLAIDISDKDNKLWDWCMANLDLLQHLGLYLEDRRYTPTWVHFQIEPPGSGKRVFVPYASAPPYPHLWDNEYDRAKYDD